MVGTPGYMAPEQARGEPTDARGDVFALGGILCAILTGHPPFCGKSVREVIQRAASGDLADALERLGSCGADAELVALCRRCLSAAATDRPATGQAVADAMAGIQAGDEMVVLTWFDRASRDELRTRPRDDPSRAPVGVFSTRSPSRPNPIGLHRVRVRAVDGLRVQVDHLEAIDQTPIIDVKPVLGPVDER